MFNFFFKLFFKWFNVLIIPVPKWGIGEAVSVKENLFTCSMFIQNAYFDLKNWEWRYSGYRQESVRESDIL